MCIRDRNGAGKGGLLWVYHSKIGDLYIKRLPNGRYGFLYDGTMWESCHSPQAAADNIARHCTGCYDWDRLDGDPDYPSDLSDWDTC